MAINKNKIPTPSEISKEPISFSPEELSELKNLRSSINNLTMNFGQINLTKIKLKEQEDFLKSELKKLENQESTLAKKLTDKYGKGTLDIETGSFIPSK